MDYEKKYKDLVKAVRLLQASNPSDDGIQNWVNKNNNVPELKESEDRQHRKWILEYLYDGLRKTDEQFKEQFKSAITWLEKQGEQSIQNVPTRETILAIWDLGNEWKELTHGSISTEHGTQLDYIQKHWEESEYYLREKQSKQKPIIHPKFRVGDWIVIQGTTYEIIKAENLNVTLTLNGRECMFDIDVLKDAHLWTIQDAKDGDVLACEDGRPFIFKGCVDPHHPNCPVAYCGIDSENLFLNDELRTCWWSNENVHPATKEQRDLLFSKMKEAGYEWDADKKELRNIEQKPAE